MSYCFTFLNIFKSQTGIGINWNLCPLGVFSPGYACTQPHLVHVSEYHPVLSANQNARPSLIYCHWLILIVRTRDFGKASSWQYWKTLRILRSLSGNILLIVRRTWGSTCRYPQDLERIVRTNWQWMPASQTVWMIDTVCGFRLMAILLGTESVSVAVVLMMWEPACGVVAEPCRHISARVCIPNPSTCLKVHVHTTQLSMYGVHATHVNTLVNITPQHMRMDPVCSSACLFTCFHFSFQYAVPCLFVCFYITFLIAIERVCPIGKAELDFTAEYLKHFSWLIESLGVCLENRSKAVCKLDLCI